MAEQEKDLMSAVGDSFGIKDAPQEQQDGGDAGDGEQQDQPISHPQGVEGGDDAQTGGDNVQQRTETDSDPHKPAQKTKDDQLFPDKPRKGPKGELLGKNGEIIASTRREKQLAYNLNRAQYAANQATRDLRAMQQHLGKFQALDGLMKTNNISPQQAQEAIQLRAMAEKDPIMAVRDIVARVLATGVTMEDLFGTNAVPEINARVITNELDRRLGPLEQQTRQRQQAQEIEDRAQVQMEQFVQHHPHAETHGVEISNLVGQHGLTPERAYFELRSWVERRGFDFTSPLKPQIEAAMQRQQRQPQNGRRMPTTPGDVRSVAPNGGVPTQQTNNSRGDFKSNTPWRDIASAVFTELNHK
jgi:hypothetical protein